MSETTIRALRPPVQFFDRGAEFWRPAKLLTVVGETSTIRVLVGVGFIRTKTVATSGLPDTAIGTPLAVRLGTTDPDVSEVVEVRGGTWGPDAPRDESAAALDNGCWPVIPMAITGATVEMWRDERPRAGTTNEW
jgi:hypothetical protein